jgi:cell fate regulator YaaT (PSP1 superfamily)
VLVVGVKFKATGKIYYFDPKDIKLEENDRVIVSSNQGIEIGKITFVDRELDTKEFDHEISPVIRKATEEDLKRDYINKLDAKEAVKVCQKKADRLSLNMQVVDGEFTFDRNKLILYFTSDNRVDFRTLVKELAAIYKNRIELRQIGVRDYAKMLGSYGICGQKCCCSRFLNEFSPLSVKMAKEQNITLDPTKISGMCGRLMCCIAFENDNYKKIKKLMPKEGQKVKTEDGEGFVISNDYVKEECKVRVCIESEDEAFEKNYCRMEIEILD